MKNQGSRERFDDLFSDAVAKYKDRIFLVMLKYVRNREDAHDLAQEAFLRAYRSRDSFRGDSSIYTWIFRIAVNLALNFKQRSRTNDFDSLDDSAPLYSESDPSEKIRSRELSNSIDRAVTLLPERQRMTFVLRYYEELPFASIADNLGITEGAAKANYHQALKKMRSHLRPFLENLA